MPTKKILVIEDNTDVRENIEEILALSGYQIYTAKDGVEGVQVAISEKPDLIVCDIMMPALDGYGVLHLLAKNQDTATIPFIFLTAKSEKSDLRKGMEMGADDYLTKPFEGVELLNAVETRLKKTELLKQKIESAVTNLKEFINRVEEIDNLALTGDHREIYTYHKKETLYKEGQKPKNVFYVLNGKIKVFRINNDGKELITNVYSKGDFFSYLPVLQETNYKDNAEILEDAELMLIPRQDFLLLLTANPQTAKQFIKILSNDIMDKEEDLLNLAYNSLRKKVAYGLNRLIEKFKQEGELETVLPVSRGDLAQSVGIATESLIRTLADFKEEGLIDIRKSKIVVINEAGLKDLPY